MNSTNRQSLYNFGRFILCVIPPLFYLISFSDNGFLGGLKWVIFCYIFVYAVIIFIAGYFMPAPGRKLHPAFIALIIPVALMTVGLFASSNPFSWPNLVIITPLALSLGLAYLQACSTQAK